MNKPKPHYTVLIIWKLTILSALLILWSDPSAAQTKAVEYVKTVYGGETTGVKTAKVFYYNAQFGDISTSFAAGKFDQLIEMGQDRRNRPLYNIYIRSTNDGLDTNIDQRYRYESENQYFQIEFAYPKWPNRIPYDLVRKRYTDSGLLKTEERIATDKYGEVTSYQKVIYEYDERNRLSQKRDSAAQSYSWNDYEIVSKYEQIITTYHYDTLGVKCYIEENKVHNSGFRQPVSRSFITDSIGKINRKYYYKLTDSYYIASEYTEFDKRKNPIRHEYFRVSHDGDKFYADSALVKSMHSQYNSNNQLTRYENKLENILINYVYNTNSQLIERIGRNHKEYFKYYDNGYLSEYVEEYHGTRSKYSYSDYNKFGIAETVKHYNDKGDMTLITKREFTYWP